MRVRMITRMANPERTAEPGDLVNVSDEEGQQLIACGFAVAAPPKPKVKADVSAELNEDTDNEGIENESRHEN